MAGAILKPIQISGLDRAELAALRKLAKTQGTSAESCARQLIQDGLAMEHRARTQTFDELFAPIQARFRESGMTEGDLGKLVYQARTGRRQRQSRKNA
jgi:hypothetical protein